LIDIVLLSVLIFSKPTRVPAGISFPNHVCRPLAQARPTPCARAHVEPRGCRCNFSHPALPHTVTGCRLVGCSVISGRPLRSRAVAGVSLHVCVCLGPVLASHATSLPPAAAAAWRGRGRVHIAGWSYDGVGPVRGLRGGGRRGWCEEWARRG
jgi:hypothetical protein